MFHSTARQIDPIKSPVSNWKCEMGTVNWLVPDRLGTLARTTERLKVMMDYVEKQIVFSRVSLHVNWNRNSVSQLMIGRTG